MSDAAFTVEPWDKYNQDLVSNVRPADWTNPEPSGVYNLVVIGAGPAGLVAAAGAAGLGAKVALIEKHLIGGDCLNVGCVPSKCLIKSARTATAITDAKEFGITTEKADVDFPAVMERMRKLRAGISANDAADRFKKLGVDVFIGEGKFTGPTTAEVDGAKLEFRKALIATGARPAVTPIEGLEEAGYLTNETVFSLTELPKRMLVLGAGPIGAELAQAFQSLGSQVTLAARSRLLSRYDPEAADIISKQFAEEGIDVKLNAAVNSVKKTATGREAVITSEGKEYIMEFDEILVAVGRAPNVEGLNLESAGVQYDTRRGVTVDDTLRTANKKIFAAGDVCMKHKFTHSADAAARIVIQNALFKGSKKITSLIIPHCTYTHPEVAHVGHYNDATETDPDTCDVYKVQMDDIDRAVTDGETSGFVKVFTQKGKDIIMGATAVSAHAGEMISELTVAMHGGIGLGKLAGAIHPYPTQSDAIKRAADAYSRTKLTPTVSKLMKKWMDWQRR